MIDYRPGGFNILPKGVKNLLILNGLFFLATSALNSAMGIDLINSMGLFYWGSSLFKPFQFITHLFMHGSMMHIFSNMFALWMFGSILENVWGTSRFLIYYFFTGLGAALIHSGINGWEMMGLQNSYEVFLSNPNPSAFLEFIQDQIPEYFRSSFNQLADVWSSQPNSGIVKSESINLIEEYILFKKNIPTVGASGAVFGVLLAFGMLFPNTRIYLYFLLPIKAKYFVILYGLLELYSGIQSSPGDNVAHWAHLGGMIFGFILIKIWNKDRNQFY